VENDKLKQIKSFANSDINSAVEHEFTAKELQAFFDRKLRHKYAKRLDQEFDIRKENTPTGNTKKKSRSIKRFLLVASIGTLLAVAINYLLTDQNREKNDLFATYKSELYTPVDTQVRGEISDRKQLFKRLSEAYVKKDFATVISEYQKLKSETDLYDLNVEQMAGIAFASLEEYDEAVNVFKGILNTKESSYSNHSTVRYLLGLVYLINDDKPNAIETLQQITKGDYKYDKVQSILEQL